MKEPFLKQVGSEKPILNYHSFRGRPSYELR